MTTTSTTSSTSTTSAGVTNPSQITNLLGAGSGVDTQALATSLTEAERAPAKAVIDKRISASTANISGYGAIKYVLGNLQTAFASLKNQSAFISQAPVISQPNALSVSAGSSTTSGTHMVEVTQLASAQRTVSANGFEKGNSPLNGGAPFNLLLSVHGAAPKTIAVMDATPKGLAVAINQANLGVNAQIVNTGDAAAPFRLMLTGTSGAANDFTLTSQPMPGKPTVNTSQGSAITGATVTESSTVSFGAGLDAGQSMTVGGLTYTATTSLSASELASAFGGLPADAITGPGTKGTYSGKLSGFSTSAASGSSIRVTSTTANINVADLAVAGVDLAQPLNGSPSTDTSQGGQGGAQTESTTVTFGSGLGAGRSVTVGGLSYTANRDISAADLAAAFKSLANGATTGSGTGTGSYSGTFTGFSTDTGNGNSFTATSVTGGRDVTDLAVTTGPTIAGLDFSRPIQTAGDAALIVDGVPVTSSSNQVTDAIAGTTLNLSAKTTVGTPATLSFTPDTASVKTKLQALVTAYNDANSMLNVVSDPKSTVADYGASLVGNSIVSQVRSQIRSMVLGGATDNAPPSGSIKALRNLGVMIDSEGVLSLDSTQFDAAIGSNFDNAVTLLSANRENLGAYSQLDAGVAGNAVKKLTAMLASTGVIGTNSANATKKISNYQKDLAALEDRMTKLKARYVQQFAAMDSIVGQSTALRNSMTATYAGMMATYTNK